MKMYTKNRLAKFYNDNHWKKKRVFLHNIYLWCEIIHVYQDEACDNHHLYMDIINVCEYFKTPRWFHWSFFTVLVNHHKDFFLFFEFSLCFPWSRSFRKFVLLFLVIFCFRFFLSFLPLSFFFTGVSLSVISLNSVSSNFDFFSVDGLASNLRLFR